MLKLSFCYYTLLYLYLDIDFISSFSSYTVSESTFTWECKDFICLSFDFIIYLSSYSFLFFFSYLYSSFIFFYLVRPIDLAYYTLLAIFYWRLQLLSSKLNCFTTGVNSDEVKSISPRLPCLLLFQPLILLGWDGRKLVRSKFYLSLRWDEEWCFPLLIITVIIWYNWYTIHEHISNRGTPILHRKHWFTSWLN